MKDEDHDLWYRPGPPAELEGRPQMEVKIGIDKLEVVAYFCYKETCSKGPVAVNFQPQHVKTTWK